MTGRVCNPQVTDTGIRSLVASKLVATVKCVGVSEHVTRARTEELKARGIKVAGAASDLNHHAANAEGPAASGGVALLSAIPAAFAAAGAALMDPRWVEDLGELLRFTTCWPSDE